MTQIAIDNTRFIFSTNFAGDPKNDRFGDRRRKATVIIPDAAMAKELVKEGVNVRATKPREDDDPETFEPEYYVSVLLNYCDRNNMPVKYPPKVYLVSDGQPPVLLDEDDVGMLDTLRVGNVNVVLNPYEYDPVEGRKTLYIRVMYVEQNLEDDPYAARYRNRAQSAEEELPF